MEEERNIITFFCFSGANCNGVGNSEMVYDRCTNWAVLTECGRTPTITTIMKNMISF